MIMRLSQFLCILTITIFFVPVVIYIKHLDFYLENEDTFTKANQNEKKVITEIVSNDNFLNKMLAYDWDSYIDSVNEISNFASDKYNVTNVEKHLESLVNTLTNFVTLEPIVNINKSCKPLKLLSYEEINCSLTVNKGNAFTGLKRPPSKIPKIGILIQFGFEVDLLEIYLNEVYEVVDKFFILESTKTHFRASRKIFLWDRVKNDERFLRFSDKIVHFTMDDADNAEAVKITKSHNTLGDNDKKIWAMESGQERLRWQKFIKWNNVTNYFGPMDLLGFGDVDEIPSRSMLNALKYCSTKNHVIDFGIWFSYGNINYAFASDFPVRGHKYTYGDPTFWTLHSAIFFSKLNGSIYFPNRNRGLSHNFILDMNKKDFIHFNNRKISYIQVFYMLGGMHMTNYGYLPYQLIRRISCSECLPLSAEFSRSFIERLKIGKLREIEIEYSQPPEEFVANGRIVELSKISEEMKDIAIAPWFYDCNRDRYPIWEGKHDLRLD